MGMTRFAATAADRARGLLLRRPDGEELVLFPCNDVHTVGMRHPIDVAFVDAAGVVLETYRNVGPLRRLRNRQAVAVVERFASCATPWMEPGDRLGVIGMKGEES